MKLTFRQFLDICPQGYSDWTVCWWRSKDITWKGSAYLMYSRLTNEQKSELKQYENVKLTVVRKNGDSETLYDLVFIGSSISERYAVKGEKS